MKFTKMEGLGNDYVYVDCTKELLPNPSEISKMVSDRHFGIGSDGLILIKTSKVADFMMEMYNADGSQSEMCGNGIRCVGKYVHDKGLTNKEEVTIETLAGIKILSLNVENGETKTIKVNMGKPILTSKEVPVIHSEDQMINKPISINGESYNITCVSMGNPHAITFVDDVNKVEIDIIGPKFENNSIFPNRVNAEFVQIVNPKFVKMRVWERGSGETLACGTGACASVIACILNGLTENKVEIQLLGGNLLIEWDRTNDVVYMTGPAKFVFDGEYIIK